MDTDIKKYYSSISNLFASLLTRPFVDMLGPTLEKPGLPLKDDTYLGGHLNKKITPALILVT